MTNFSFHLVACGQVKGIESLERHLAPERPIPRLRVGPGWEGGEIQSAREEVVQVGVLDLFLPMVFTRYLAFTVRRAD